MHPHIWRSQRTTWRTVFCDRTAIEHDLWQILAYFATQWCSALKAFRQMMLLPILNFYQDIPNRIGGNEHYRTLKATFL